MKYRPFTVRFFFYLWRFKLTRGGRYLFYGLLLSTLGTVSVQIPVYQLFFALGALLGTSWLAGRVLRPKLELRARLPLKTTSGEPAVGEVTLVNRGRLPGLDVSVGYFDLPKPLVHQDRERSVPVGHRGESATMPLTLLPLKRGLYPLPDLRAFSTFPFNLIRSAAARIPQEALLVLPAFHPLQIALSAGTRYQPGGIAFTSRSGESPEYIGNREYVPGESMRRLDFRSWARLGKPVIREYQEEYYSRIALVLDTYIPAGRRERAAGFAELEAAVSLTAAVADALSAGESIIDLFAAGAELHVFRAGRHTAHFDNLLEILACVDACRTDPFTSVAPAIADELGNISAVVCVLLDWDEPRRELARAALEAGCSLKVLVVRDGETTEPLDGVDAGDVAQLSVLQIQSGAAGVL